MVCGDLIGLPVLDSFHPGDDRGQRGFAVGQVAGGKFELLGKSVNRGLNRSSRFVLL